MIIKKDQNIYLDNTACFVKVQLMFYGIEFPGILSIYLLSTYLPISISIGLYLYL